MKNSKQLRLIALLSMTLAAPFLIGAGCNADDGGANQASGTGNSLSSMLGALPGIPGIDSHKVEQARQAVELGEKGSDLLSLNNPRRQAQIGQTVAVAITNRYPVSTDDALNDYVNLVGLTIASVAPNPEAEYAFGVLDTPEVGAYSAPGGYVFITRGAIELLEDESELAAVLAHEVAHVALNHGIEAVKAAKGADFMMTAAKTQSDELRMYGQQADALVDAIVVKGYSREQETRADAAAVKYLAAAGYDPDGLHRFLQKLRSKTGSGGGLGQLMSTHPGTGERASAVARQVQAQGIKGVTLKERFAARTGK